MEHDISQRKFYSTAQVLLHCRKIRIIAISGLEIQCLLNTLKDFRTCLPHFTCLTGKLAGDCNFLTGYTAAFRLCSRKAIWLSFLLVHILGITAVAWQRVGGGKCPVSQHISSPSSCITIHQSQLKTYSSKTDKIAPRKEKKFAGNGFPISANCKLLQFSHKCSLSSTKAFTRSVLTSGN